MCETEYRENDRKKKNCKKECKRWKLERDEGNARKKPEENKKNDHAAKRMKLRWRRWKKYMKIKFLNKHENKIKKS